MKPKFIMLIGVPGSGKSTYAKKISEKYKIKILSSDSIRKELYGSEEIQKDNWKVFEKLNKIAINSLNNGESVIYDATNINMKRRIHLLNSLPICEKRCIIFISSLELCIERQNFRDRKVPNYVIEKQIKSFQVPYFYEGWDYIDIINYDSLKIKRLFKESMLINHDNPNHKFTIGEHLKSSYNFANEKKYNNLVKYSALLHDIGKIYSKNFDEDGIAHYISHQNISAYLFLLSEEFINLSVKDRLHIAVLIQFHMDFYLREEKGMKKLFDLIGEELEIELKQLHECDLAAH